MLARRGSVYHPLRFPRMARRFSARYWFPQHSNPVRERERCSHQSAVLSSLMGPVLYELFHPAIVLPLRMSSPSDKSLVYFQKLLLYRVYSVALFKHWINKFVVRKAV